MTLPAKMKVEVDERPLPRAPSYRRAVTEAGADLVVRWRWFEPAKHVFLLFFCVVWDSFLTFWYGAAITGLARGGASGPVLLMLLFPLLHVAVGVGLTYTVIAGFLNSTRVGVRGGALFVQHGPLPWKGNRALDAREVSQLFTKEKVTQGKGGPTSTFELHAILAGGERVPLVTGFSDVEQALWLEQALEERMGIVDVEVAGEV